MLSTDRAQMLKENTIRNETFQYLAKLSIAFFCRKSLSFRGYLSNLNDFFSPRPVKIKFILIFCGIFSKKVLTSHEYSDIMRM